MRSAVQLGADADRLLHLLFDVGLGLGLACPLLLQVRFDGPQIFTLAVQTRLERGGGGLLRLQRAFTLGQGLAQDRLFGPHPRQFVVFLRQPQPPVFQLAGLHFQLLAVLLQAGMGLLQFLIAGLEVPITFFQVPLQSVEPQDVGLVMLDHALELEPIRGQAVLARLQVRRRSASCDVSVPVLVKRPPFLFQPLAVVVEPLTLLFELRPRVSTSSASASTVRLRS